MAVLDDFIGKFNKYGGAARPNRFEVEIICPFAVFPSLEEDRHASFMVKSTDFPGKNLRTVPNENIYGPSFQMAQGVTYAETIQMTFFVTAQMEERKYFETWMNYIYKPDTYNLEYYNNYKASVSIWQLDMQDKRTAGIKLLDCYPKTIGPLEFSHDSASSISEMSVEMVFKELYMIDSNGNANDDRNNPTSSNRGVIDRGSPNTQNPFAQVQAVRDRFRRFNGRGGL